MGNDLDISGFTLDLSGSQTTSGTAVIATYGGNLTEASGGGFDSVIGLNGRQISYNGGQITITGAAIIPEVTNIIPLSLAFVPLLGMRKRRLRK